MSYNPFIAPHHQLPKTLPVFPLPGTIVIPGNELPLNIFEPRYLNMVSDALSTHRMIGMIQPNSRSEGENDLYQTGCAGRITQYRETSDGRIEIVLSGVCRYDVEEELPTVRGYRLIVPDWSRFVDDYIRHEEQSDGEHDKLMQILKCYFETKRLEADWNVLERLSTVRLMNSLSMALPLSAHDKQMLLETLEPSKRLSTFIALLTSQLQIPESVIRH